ncbi:hypothetical protein [Christiangramia aestuarii]|uniref:Uncharacterized protein n=1 Tax=Christiangramia aestuarii TaxID=1028746 RepID=A0A7K1LRD8_9FLAO|nr:hypothetical protein [Christiangramia aestuarii]MUP43040.1 hypothetical protein [Christiangramia aestuarii]
MKYLMNYFSLPFMRNEISFCFYAEKKSRMGKYHVIHTKPCELLPEKPSRIKMGFFENFEEVEKAGRKQFGEVRFCSFCCDFS